MVNFDVLQQQFSSDLMHEFTNLRKLVQGADFTLKSKFPPQLRAPLAQVAVKAIELEEYGEAFFKYLPDIFPYNKFTMTVSSDLHALPSRSIPRIALTLRFMESHRNSSSDSYTTSILRY